MGARQAEPDRRGREALPRGRSPPGTRAWAQRHTDANVYLLFFLGPAPREQTRRGAADARASGGYRLQDVRWTEQLPDRDDPYPVGTSLGQAAGPGCPVSLRPCDRGEPTGLWR